MAQPIGPSYMQDYVDLRRRSRARAGNKNDRIASKP
jgi:hypothetical protein